MGGYTKKRKPKPSVIRIAVPTVAFLETCSPICITSFQLTFSSDEAAVWFNTYVNIKKKEKKVDAQNLTFRYEHEKLYIQKRVRKFIDAEPVMSHGCY